MNILPPVSGHTILLLSTSHLEATKWLQSRGQRSFLGPLEFENKGIVGERIILIIHVTELPTLPTMKCGDQEALSNRAFI